MLDNGAILTLSKIIKHVMSSASEAETAALFYNCKAAAPSRVTLMEMGHPQDKTQVTTDNSAAQNELFSCAEAYVHSMVRTPH